MSSSNNEFTHLHMKTQRQIFVLVSSKAHQHAASVQSLIEGDMGVYGIAVMSFFSSGILVILILMFVLQYHLALRYAVFHPSG